MSVKDAILQMLESHREEDISGEQMAQELGVSRAAIWKAINGLKAQGYPITAVTNRGYRLREESDLLSAQGIRPFLLPDMQQNPLFVFDTIDSTSLELKRSAMQGAAHLTAVIADRQTLGRGRFGRSFFSPPGCGIYLSLLLKPSPQQLSDATLITTAAAVAVCRAIERLTTLCPQIKWVNDIYLNGKKVCGILTEAVTDVESGAIESVVIGCGINFKLGEEKLPEELAKVAGTLFGADKPPVSRNRLVAEILNELIGIWQAFPARDFLHDYRSRSFLLGKEIVFSRGETKYAAIAKAIDDEGALVVQLKNGEQMVLRSGEVSVRPADLASTLPVAGDYK